MEEEKKKKRGWVKDAAIIFLAVLLVLTFFSNTILNRSLPEVATVYVAEGTITSKVRGTGTVTARENYDVTIESTRKVQSVLVRVGDEVQVGDVLFTLQPGDSDELEKAEKQLKTLEENYQLWLLDLSIADYYEYDRSISDAREALMEAREARDEAEVTAADRKEYEEKLAELEAAIEAQQALVDSGSESLAELDDSSGVLRELELEKRELKDKQQTLELRLRELEERATAADERLKSVEEEWQAVVDEANETLNEITKEFNEKFGGHQDPDYEPVERAQKTYDEKKELTSQAKEATAKAENELDVAWVVYGDDYDELVKEATYLEYDHKVYEILDDTEAKYRAKHKIPKNEPLTEEQEEEVQKQAQPAIDKLGARNAYVAKELDIYLPAAAEKFAGTPMANAYNKINMAEENLDLKKDAEKEAKEAEKEAKKAYDDAYEKYKKDKENDEDFQEMDQQKTKAEKAVEKAKSDMERALEPLKKAKDTADQNLKDVKKQASDADLAMNDLQEKISRLTSEEYQDRQKELDTDQKKLDELNTELEKLKKDMEDREAAYKQAKETVKNKERALEDELRRLEQQKKADGKQQLRDNISQRDKLEEIEEQRALVEELSSADNGTEVRANVSGKIQELNVSAGHKAEAGSVLATIEVPDLGYSMSFSVTTEQARRLKVGDSATVSNFYWGSQIVATLVSIQTDPQNPQGSRILNFDVTGDVTAGNSLTIAVGERNANYDMVVPNSAVRSDTNGSFVLMVTAKNSPLGNRYFATRVNVEVVASDEQYSAISGAIEAYDSVITTASRNAPISSGDQVRLADSNNG